MIFPPADDEAGARAQARRIYDGLMSGTVDRTLFTPAANAFFRADVMADYAKSLTRWPSTEFVAGGEGAARRNADSSYRIRAGGVSMDLTTMTMPDGKIDQVHSLRGRAEGRMWSLNNE